MISHLPPTIPLSFRAKYPNFFPLVLVVVAVPRTQYVSLQNLHLRHQSRPQNRRLLASRKEVAVAPAVFLQRPDGDDERRASAARESGEMEGSAALEDEILEFMLKSPNPDRFPTRKELIAAGRKDLAEAITKRGGWLAYGWDLDEEADDDACGDGPSVNGVASHHPSLTNGGGSFFPDDSRIFEQRSSIGSVSDWQDSASSLQSSSGRPIETEGGEDTGIEGILSRLEKERSFLYSVDSGKKEHSSLVSGKNGDSSQLHTPTDTVAGGKSGSRSVKEFLKSGDTHFQNGSLSYSGNTRSSHEPETWRLWSAQRAGLPQAEFKAEEILPHESGRQSISDEEEYAINNSLSEHGDSRHTNNDTENFQSWIHARIQQLQSELTSVLHVLRSGTETAVSDKVNRSSLEELHKLSDAWEFKETEIMRTKDKLRSMRAKLAVLEGKMALEVIEAQKMVEERQKRVEHAKRALSVLQTVCIIWPNSASEVFLVGSFDGWTSQRRMERSASGIFSLNLKLYPGQYEIKFIVDGVWRIDPLRPVVNSSGYENNRLTVS